jgi:signal transduction histidine kinase
VLTNLISNANKYTPVGGQIKVRAFPQGGFVVVEVSDNGIGISQEDQSRLFTQFFRSEDEAVREQLGWGLGLNIVKKLVDAQGGEISCVSTPGQGSTFTFTVPTVPTGNGHAAPRPVS